MTDSSAPAPLIVTAELPPELQSHYNELRKKHFPEELNHLGAHLTLFHALPGAKEKEIATLLDTLTAETAKPSAKVAKVMSLGRGVAFRVDAPELHTLRTGIVDIYAKELTKQDLVKKEFHITVQNKVTPEESKALFADLKKDFEAQDTFIESLTLWQYLGGPWKKVVTHAFRGEAAPAPAEAPVEAPPEIP